MKTKTLFKIDNPKYIYTPQMLKSLRKISELAEKQQRKKSKIFDRVIYDRPNVAGAFYKDNTTQIITNHFGIVINEKLQDLQMIPETVEEESKHNLVNHIIRDDTYKEDTNFSIDRIKTNLKEDSEYLYSILNNTYPANQLKLICDCLIEPLIYGSTIINKPLIIEGLNGKGIQCAIRCKEEKNDNRTM